MHSHSSAIKYEPMLAAAWAFLKTGNTVEAVIRFARVTVELDREPWPADREAEYRHAFDMALFGDLVAHIVTPGCSNEQVRFLANSLLKGGAVVYTDDNSIPIRPIDLSEIHMHVVRRAKRVSSLSRPRLVGYVSKYHDELSR